MVWCPQTSEAGLTSKAGTCQRGGSSRPDDSGPRAATCSLHAKGATEEPDAELVPETEGGAAGVAGRSGLRAGPRSRSGPRGGLGSRPFAEGPTSSGTQDGRAEALGRGKLTPSSHSPLTWHFTPL